MGIARVSQIGLKTLNAWLYGGLILPSAVNTRVGLLSPGLSLGESSTISNLIAGELLQANGYSRQILGQTVASIDTTGDTLTITDHRRTLDQPCYLITTTTLPTATPAITAGLEMFVRAPTSNTIQLASVPGGSAIDLQSVGSGTHYLRMSGAYDSSSDKRFEALYNEVRFTAAGGAINWMGWFMLFDSMAASNIVVTSINPATDQITTPTHGIITGEVGLVTTDSGGTQPSGVDPAVGYFIRAVSTTVISLHTTQAGAIANTGLVDITGAGSGTIRVRYGKGTLMMFEYFSDMAVSSINAGTDVISTTLAHNLTTGTALFIQADGGGTQPPGTSSSTAYFGRVLSPTTLTLHTTASGAIANTGLIDITGAGVNPITLRFAGGAIADGQTQRIEIPVNFANIADGVGV